MDRFHEMEVFVAVADAGSFVKAGKRLHISPPAVTRAVASLEDRLGTRLFNRTTRSLNLTEAGRRFLESGRRLIAEIDTAEKDAAGEMAAPHGHLAISSSVTFGRLILTSLVTEFLSGHPRVTTSLLLLDRVVNLVDEGIDVSVRIGNLPDSSLVARHVGSARRMLVASPAYMAKRGAPDAPADLKLHAIIAFTGFMPNREWRYGVGKTAGSVALAPRLEINDAASAIAAAEAGEGITIALSYMVAEKIRAGVLVPILERNSPAPVPVHVVYPTNRLVAPKVRAFLDFMAPRLRSKLAELEIPQAKL